MSSYGSISPDGKDQKQPSTEICLTIDPSDPFREKTIFANEEFWKEARRAYVNGGGISKQKAQRITRAKWLLKRFSEEQPDRDLVDYMLTVVHDEYLEHTLHINEDHQHHYPTFVYELSEMILVLLEMDNEGEEKYSKLCFPTPGSNFKRSILHIAAERALTQIIKYTVEFYPSLVHNPTNVDEDNYFPLHFLLEKKDKIISDYVTQQTDEAASFLVSVMENERVRSLFESTDLEAASFNFSNFIVHGGYNKTCLALLDCMMNSDWPFVKNGEEDEDDYSSCIPNVPVRYHFFYRMLDGDDLGQSPVTEDGTPNEDFRYSSKSCLQLLAENSSKEQAIQHPVVRTLVRHKWETYARSVTYVHASLYALFMVMLAVALFTQPLYRKPTTYEDTKDYIRLVCEIGSLAFTFLYFCMELYQLSVEKLRYFRDFFNYMDIIGMILIILVVPLRYLKYREAELIVSGFGFFMNFLRILKFFPAIRPLGIYSKTIARIIKYDISKFLVIFVIVMFSFTGLMYMILMATKSLNLVGGFWEIFLQETRAMTEAGGFAEEYGDYKWWVIALLMVNMLSILVILMNVLIGQISARYEEAMMNASISYDIDRCILVAKCERTPFKNFLNFRVKYYRDADYVANEQVAEELVEEWIDVQGHDKIEKRHKAIKMFTGKRSVQKRSMKENPQSLSLVAPD